MSNDSDQSCTDKVVIQASLLAYFPGFSQFDNFVYSKTGYEAESRECRTCAVRTGVVPAPWSVRTGGMEGVGNVFIPVSGFIAIDSGLQGMICLKPCNHKGGR